MSLKLLVGGKVLWVTVFNRAVDQLVEIMGFSRKNLAEEIKKGLLREVKDIKLREHRQKI